MSLDDFLRGTLPNGKKVPPGGDLPDVPVARVVALLHEVDGSGDPEFLESMEQAVLAHPVWVEVWMPLKRLLIEHANEDVVEEYAALAADSAPPIVAIVEGEGWNILDGNHRANAAIARGDRTIRAVVPRDQWAAECARAPARRKAR